ncbi:MAG: hypothetical protein U9R57_06140 [Thermodesulfobacteriota bacterium]|nr:hypothetical protein [Thermodesulfobacteriota bacterium]
MVLEVVNFRDAGIPDETEPFLIVVFTTGSTVHKCAKALKEAGANRVEVLTICRADKIFS